MPPLLLLRDRRRDLSLTQAAVACATGISIPTLRNLEQGKGSIESLSRTLPYLQLRWSWFYDIEAGPEFVRRRRMRGLSQRALAERVGCSRPTIIAIERDLTGRVETLLRVLSVLGIRQALRPEPAPGRPGLIPATNDPARDLVMTPPDLAAKIIAHFADRMSGHVLDPARCAGAFLDQFPDHVESALVEDPQLHPPCDDAMRSYRLHQSETAPPSR